MDRVAGKSIFTLDETTFVEKNKNFIAKRRVKILFFYIKELTKDATARKVLKS